MQIINQRKPDIYFHFNGQIDITAKVSKALDLQPGDTINVWEAGGEHYLYVSARSVAGNVAGVCRKVNDRSRFLRTNFKGLTDKINEICNADESHLPVGEAVEIENVGKALTLITRNNLYAQRR